jgi:Pregnancy-associated plasma protein-A
VIWCVVRFSPVGAQQLDQPRPYDSSSAHGRQVLSTCPSLPNATFVDDRATGLQDGSRNHPFNTLGQGVDNTAASGTLLAATGTYPEAIVIQKPIEIRSCGGNVLIGGPYELHVHAIPLSDSDGGRAFTITPGQVTGLVDQANVAYGPLGIRFRFDPVLDWEPMANTQLNSLVNGGANWWEDPNRVANRYPGQVVIFFRWGVGRNPDGTPNPNIPSSNAFAYPPDIGPPIPPDAPLPTPNVNFVAFYNSASLAAINVSTFVHELGHYLGLFHTFPGWSDNLTNTPSSAAAKIRAAGNSAAGLDGDLLADTPPDAGSAYYVNQVNSNPCAGPGSYVISGIVFSPDRQNVMSYFGPCQPPYHVSPQQMQLIKKTLRSPVRTELISPPG